MRLSATTQLIYTLLNFLSPRKRVASSLLHFGDWTNHAGEQPDNLINNGRLAKPRQPAWNPDAKGHPAVNQVSKAGLAAADIAGAVAIQNLFHSSIPHASAILPP